MATTATIYPYDVRQTTGGHYQPFTKLNSIKQASGYAVSADYLDIKSGIKHTPSTINAYFNVNLPANAEVRKVTVEYKHYVTKAPTSRIFAILPAPNLVLTSKINSDARTNYGEFDAKGQSPGPSAINQQCTFNLTQYKDIPLSFFNNGNLRVVLQYKKNNSKYSGKVHLAYIRVKIEYVQPSFDVSMSLVSGGYNREEISLKATISNYNLTKGDPVVNLQLPLGISFVRASGNGTVTQPQNRVLTWTPKVNRAGSVSVEIVVLPNVSYPTSDKTWTGTVEYTMPSFNRSNSLNISVTERPPAPDTETDDSENIITDNGNSFEYYNLTNDVEMDIELTLSDEDKALIDNNMMMYCIPNPGFEPITVSTWDEIKELHDDDSMMRKVNGEWNPCTGGIPKRCMVDYHVTNLKFHKLGRFSLVVWASSGNLFNGKIVKQINLESIPSTDYLNICDYCIMDLTEEELCRLGDDYVYTVQSDMKLTSNESYVRNWHKNFRIGVFNNRIEANCTEYIDFVSNDSQQSRELIIPSKFDISQCRFKAHLNQGDIGMKYNNEPYDVDENGLHQYGHDDLSIDILDYTLPVEFDNRWTLGGNEKILTFELIDKTTSEIIHTIYYCLKFEQEGTLPPYRRIEDTTDYNNLTDDEIFENANYWGNTLSSIGEYESLTCEFPYTSEYPLHILITGDFNEGDPSNNQLTFNEPAIIEEYTERLTNGLFLEPIDEVISDEGSSSTITLQAFDISNTHVLYDLPLDDGYGTDSDMAIRGIELTGEVEQTDRLILYAKLRSPTGESRQRSIIIEDTKDFSIGGNGDLWGYNTLDMVNLEDWEIELTISNNLDEVDGNLTLGNLQLNLYVERVEPSNIVCYINGEDLRYYGVFITDVSIPEGLQTDTRYLEVDGTDHNDPYNQSIRQKEIEIEFELGNDCDLQANTLSRRELAKLLVNDRDEYNRPIPNTIEFSHYPDIYWEYIMEDAIKDKIEIGSYTDGKVTLVVPAGTAYDKESTTTSNTGYVNGLATINPILIVKPTDEIITIREEVTGQEFHMGYSGEWNDKILEIDCEDRIAWLKTDEDDTDPINLNRYVDFNSDWFRLKGEFNFVGINCIIRTVDYQERW